MHDDLVTQLNDFFDNHGSGIACAYLFGSYARGAAGKASDLDVAVLFENEPPKTLDGLGLGLAADLEAFVGLPVDLIVFNSAAPDLAHRVLRDGILVQEADREARVTFEVQSRAEYFDLLPYLQEYRRAGSG